jgi:SAM-dependent methyltransferase
MLNQGVSQRDYYELHYIARDWRSYNHILSQIVLFSQPGTILDVGAGIGLLGEAAYQWGLDYKGIEGSADAVEMARQRFEGIDLQQHFLSQPFPFPDDVFQTVILNQVIEHLEPNIAEATITESFRTLKPGGLLLINSPSKFNEYERKSDITHINMYSPTELCQLLICKGFVRIKPINFSLNLLGNSFLGRGILYILFKLTQWDKLSATANCIAYKPIVNY